MITAYYSSIFEQPVTSVWSLIRDFNNYPAYIDGVTESVIEDSKAGDEVGAVRRFLYAGNWIRQRLGAHSDEARSLTYVGMDPFAFPHDIVPAPAPASYEGTMHLLPIVDGDRCFIEWSVAIDARPSDEKAWQKLFLALIPDWTDSLRRTLARTPTEQVREKT